MNKIKKGCKEMSAGIHHQSNINFNKLQDKDKKQV